MRRLSLSSRGNVALGAHGLLRFRTNDVLLGTSGVGVCVSVVSNSPGFFLLFIFIIFFMLYRSPRFRPLSLMKRSLAGSLAASGEGRQFETCFDPYIIFSHLSGLNFA